MYIKFCEFCGKQFTSKSDIKKYCTYRCARDMARKRQEENEQLCWRCKNACGGCSWSKELLPVKGWKAESTIIKDSMGDFESYKIKRCPEFVRG